MKRSTSLIVALIGIALTGPARAIVIYNSFGPGDTYITYEGAEISGPGSSGGLFTSGFSFQPATTLSLESIQVAIGTISGSNAFSLSLQAADGPSGMPGTVLETFQVNDQMGSFGLANPLISVTSVAHPELEAGDTYWLVAEGEGDGLAAWNSNNLGLYGTYFSFQGGHGGLADDQLLCAYEITGVPEPASGSLYFFGFIALALHFRSNKRKMTNTFS